MRYIFVGILLSVLSSCAAKKTSSSGATNPDTGNIVPTPTPTPTTVSTTIAEESLPWNPSLTITGTFASNENLYLTPSYAVLDNGGMWGTLKLNTYAPIVNVIYRNLILKTLNVVGGLPTGYESSANFRRRSSLFLVDYVQSRTLNLTVRNKPPLIKTSAIDGDFIFQYVDTLGAKDTDQLQAEGSFMLTPNVQLSGGTYDMFPGAGLEVIRPKGISVISDIDDTIKVTNVGTSEMLKSTFVDDFTAVPGMAQFYSYLKNTCKASFHYVSGTPEQFASELWAFFVNNSFPFGSLHLKRTRIIDQSYLALVASQATYKREILSEIFKNFPQRQFILIGDTGEQDPDIYATYAGLFPNQVKKVILRSVNVLATDQSRVNQLFGASTAKVQLIQSGSEVTQTCNF